MTMELREMIKAIEWYLDITFEDKDIQEYIEDYKECGMEMFSDGERDMLKYYRMRG